MKHPNQRSRDERAEEQGMREGPERQGGSCGGNRSAEGRPPAGAEGGGRRWQAAGADT